MMISGHFLFERLFFFSLQVHKKTKLQIWETGMKKQSRIADKYVSICFGSIDQKIDIILN